jgi:hypothetical protein
MKRLQTKLYAAILILTLLASTAATASSFEETKTTSTSANEHQSEYSSPTSREQGATKVIGDLLGEITVPSEAAGFFNDFYNRNKTEVLRIFSDNPYLIWETLGVVVDALPSLRTIADQDGRLYLDGATYARANTLFERYRGLASSQLAADLDRTKSYVDSRTEGTDSGGRVIDLNDHYKYEPEIPKK